jgi:hypothetical protein
LTFNVVCVECNPDGYLLKAIGIPRHLIRHEGGIGNVVVKVDSFPSSVGLIDEDPNGTHPRALQHFQTFGENNGIRLMRRFESPDQTLVVVCPTLETWLLQRAKECNVDPKDYGLPDDPKILHKIDTLEELPTFREFIEALSTDKGLLQLKDWISGL